MCPLAKLMTSPGGIEALTKALSAAPGALRSSTLRGLMNYAVNNSDNRN